MDRAGPPLQSGGGPRPLRARQQSRRSIALARELPLEQTDAVRIVAILKSRGLVTGIRRPSREGRTREEVGVFLARHWAEASRISPKRTAMGHRIGKRHAYEMSRCVNLYWKPYFAGKPGRGAFAAVT